MLTVRLSAAWQTEQMSADHTSSDLAVSRSFRGSRGWHPPSYDAEYDRCVSPCRGLLQAPCSRFHRALPDVASWSVERTGLEGPRLSRSSPGPRPAEQTPPDVPECGCDARASEPSKRENPP